MDNDKNKKPTPPEGGHLPHPPAGKKPGGVPKGPVPPRSKMSLPRIPAPGKGPGLPSRPQMGGGPGSKPPFPGPKPGLPSMKPPMGGIGGSMPPPSRPGVGGPPSSLPPGPMKSQLGQFDGSRGDLEGKVADLEKRLNEEREKVLLASLRAKEEEALSAKVETSIQEIQDKLRREKKEQELEDARRKAESQLTQVERRLAEEREAWVSTLKNQLNQRDQVSQEMEGHFSTRLKDLEYRWAQEKARLEDDVRTRESDLARLKQESLLKTEQEKAHFEDRLRTLQNDREKLERDNERLKDKMQTERDLISGEKHQLHEDATRLEAQLKMTEDKARMEKASVDREMESRIDLVQKQANVERDGLEKKLTDLTHQLDIKGKALVEKVAELEPLRSAIISTKHQAELFQTRFLEKEKEGGALKNQVDELSREITRLRDGKSQRDDQVAELKRDLDVHQEKIKSKDIEKHEEIEDMRKRMKHHEVELKERWTVQKGDFEKRIKEIEEDHERSKQKREEEHDAQLTQSDNRRRHLEERLEAIANEMIKVRESSKSEVNKAYQENENRMRTLQTRLDWYDSNAQREYALARDKVRDELESLQKERDAAVAAQEELQTMRQHTENQVESLKEKAGEVAQVHIDALAAKTDEFDQMTHQYKELQQDWDLTQKSAEGRIHELQIQLRKKSEDIADLETAKISMSQEIKQRQATWERNEETLEKTLKEHNQRETRIETLDAQRAALQEQVNEYKKALSDAGGQTGAELKRAIDSKDGEINALREKLRDMKVAAIDAEKTTELGSEKEKVLKTLIHDKEAAIDELNGRVGRFEREVMETRKEGDFLREETKRKLDNILNAKTHELEDRLAIQKRELEEQSATEKKDMDAAHRYGLGRLHRPFLSEILPGFLYAAAWFAALLGLPQPHRALSVVIPIHHALYHVREHTRAAHWNRTSPTAFEVCACGFHSLSVRLHDVSCACACLLFLHAFQYLWI